MGRRKIQKIEEGSDINSLVNELETANKELEKVIIDETLEDKKEEDIPNDLDTRRQELIKLAEDVQIDHSVKYIKKASSKLFKHYEEKRLQKTNEFLTDMLIYMFSKLLDGLDAIDSFV